MGFASWSAPGRWRCRGAAAPSKFGTDGSTGPVRYRRPRTETIVETMAGSWCSPFECSPGRCSGRRRKREGDRVPATLYYDKDASLDPLIGKTIAIVGY